MNMHLEGVDYLFWRTIAHSLVDTEKVTAIYTGIKSAALNPVIRSKFSESEAISVIQQVKEFYSKKSAQWCWCVSSGEGLDYLPLILLSAGFKLIEKAPRMGIKLSNVRFEQLNADVREVLCKQDFNDWAKPIRSGFGGEDDSFAELLSKKPFGPGQPFRHYVGYHRDEPVTSCTLSMSKYGARIDNMATILKMRKMGFGMSVLNKALYDAYQAGIQNCYLDSSEEGFKLYSKVGFVILDEMQIFGLKH